jgi:glucose-1-phosphate thymidylyltransferase
MKVIIPVAGAGTRMQPHTLSLAKPLMTVADKPVLAHILDAVAQLQPEHITFVIGCHGDQIVAWVDQNCQTPHSFVEQPELLGLGYAVLLALEPMETGPVLVMLGDTIVDGDLSRFAAAGSNVVGVCPVEMPSAFGIAELQSGQIARLIEKPTSPVSNLALIGVYAFQDINPLRDTLHKLHADGRRTRGEFQLTDALQQMIDNGEVLVPFRFERWLDCGQPASMLEANRALLEHLPEPPTPEGVTIIPPVFIARTATVTNSTIGPHASIGEHCTITGSSVQDSIISDHAHIEDSTLDQSLIGPGARLVGQSGQFNVGRNSVLESSE